MERSDIGHERGERDPGPGRHIREIDNPLAGPDRQRVLQLVRRLSAQ